MRTQPEQERSLCEFCFRRAVATTDAGPLCRAHNRAYDEGADFEGCVTRTGHERLKEILADPLARYLLREAQVRGRMGGYHVVEVYGDPREWPVYKEFIASGAQVPEEPERQPAVGTHEHYAVHQNHWTGEWHLQRAVRQGLSTAYDKPLPGHAGFKTKKAALAFKREHLS